MPTARKASTNGNRVLTSAARKTPVPNTVPVTGVPAGRLLELQLETNLPGPYVITDEIVIEPPSKARADEIRRAQMSVMIYNALMSQALQQPDTTEELLNGLTEHINKAEREYNVALLGEHVDVVEALMETLNDQLVQAFRKDIASWFFPNQPVDGKCGTCGQVIDTEAAGKVPASSP